MLENQPTPERMSRTAGTETVQIEHVSAGRNRKTEAVRIVTPLDMLLRRDVIDQDSYDAAMRWCSDFLIGMRTPSCVASYGQRIPSGDTGTDFAAHRKAAAFDIYTAARKVVGRHSDVLLAYCLNTPLDGHERPVTLSGIGRRLGVKNRNQGLVAGRKFVRRKLRDTAEFYRVLDNGRPTRSR